MANVKATDLIDFTRASKGHALAKVSYGEELVENGTFDSDLSGWTAGSSWSWVSGKAYDGDTQAGPHAELKQSISVTSGKVYVVTFDVSGLSGGNPSVLWAGSTLVQITADGSYTEYVVASGSSQTLQFSGQNAIYYVDNVSVKEVLFNQPDGSLQLFEHPNNIPRIEYDADGNLLGLLIEEARTNLVVYSEDFSQWNGLNQMLPFGSGSTLNATTAPNGTLTADLLVPNTTNSNSHYVRNIASVAVGNDYTFSVYVKAAGYTTCSLRLYGTDAPITNFDLSAETTDQSAATITNVGGGWYRCTLTGEATSTGSWYYVYPNQQATFTGDGSSGVYVWGAQLEAGSFPTSYIKSNQGSQTARSADVASIDVDQFGYNQSEGTVTVTGRSYEPGNDNYFFEMSEDGANRNFIKCTDASHFVATSSNVLQANIDAGTITANTEAKLAVAIKADNFGVSLDGGAVVTDTSGTPKLNVSEFRIGSNRSGGELLNGHIKSITYTPKRLSNAKLQELTS